MLAVKLKPGERLVVNGAVLHNGNARNVLYFANRASILRERDVMQVEQAVTPTSRIYFTVQLMLLNPDDADTYRTTFEQLMTGLLRAFKSPPILKALTDCVHWVSGQDYYKALAALRPVLDYETKLLGRPGSEPTTDDGALRETG
ncbi:MAG: flagellar biosynthesis repressor FlbT [Dongiaceae bacterium]